MSSELLYVLFRPEDLVILGIYSTEDRAEEQRKLCYGGGSDVLLEETTLDAEYEEERHAD